MAKEAAPHLRQFAEPGQPGWFIASNSRLSAESRLQPGLASVERVWRPGLQYVTHWSVPQTSVVDHSSDFSYNGARLIGRLAPIGSAPVHPVVVTRWVGAYELLEGDPVIHVVMVSKALVNGAYQRKLEEMVQLPGIRLTALVPPYWRDSRGITPLQRSYTCGYRLIETPLAWNGHFHLHFYPQLGHWLRTLQPDLLHMDEEPLNVATCHGVWLARRMRIPVCFYTWQNLHRRYPPPFNTMEQYTYRHAVHALAGSEEAIRVLRAKGYRGPASLVPQFGVDPDHFTPRPADPPAATGRGMVIGYAGGLVPEKGLDLLLRAAAHLPNCPVRLVGEGRERPALARLAAELGMADRVEFVTRLPSTAMPQFYQGLDVLVLPSRAMTNWKEQFGRVLIEAMASGVPVIGANSGEIPQVIGPAGLTFPEGDVEALRGQLLRLLEDGALWRQLAAEGRARVLAHYTQARIAALTVAAYRAAVPTTTAYRGDLGRLPLRG